MEQKEIAESNLLIAKFMGGEFRTVNCGIDGTSSEHFYMPGDHILDYRRDFVEDLPYHADWNWLIPVVEKIQTEHPVHITIRVGITAIEHSFMAKKSMYIPFDEIPPIAESNTKDFIGNVYDCVVTYLKWYNERTKKDNP